ncbi:MAG: PIN domain-containing protein [Ignavibacteriales bacterium]|nr:MAG: PIN domain-containing protein [Ignavibacteriales bacterium]
MSKLLLDTNVLIYSIDEDSKYFRQAQNIFSEEHELFTTSKNISEFLSVITRIPNPLSLSDALLLFDDFARVMTILYPDGESSKIFKELLSKYQPKGLQIHDYEIISIGLSHQINTIATFNEKDFNDVTEIKLHIL